MIVVLLKVIGIGISKRTIHKFNIGYPLVKDNINFKMVKNYEKLTTSNYRQIYYNFINRTIQEKLVNIDNVVLVYQ
jgi:hypothetical protein